MLATNLQLTASDGSQDNQKPKTETVFKGEEWEEQYLWPPFSKAKIIVGAIIGNVVGAVIAIGITSFFIGGYEKFDSRKYGSLVILGGAIGNILGVLAGAYFAGIRTIMYSRKTGNILGMDGKPVKL